MDKELEALERLYCAGRLDLDYVANGRQQEDYELVEKALKSLEIIKEKVQEIKWLGFVYKDGTNIYNFEYRETPTKEEHDSLKEILK